MVEKYDFRTMARVLPLTKSIQKLVGQRWDAALLSADGCVAGLGWTQHVNRLGFLLFELPV
jgi:hypothetical protein